MGTARKLAAPQPSRSTREMNELNGHDFAITFPCGWLVDDSATPAVCHGPTGEEVIISASRIDGNGAESERGTVVGQLFANAKVAMRNAAAQSDLRSISPLSEHVRPDGSLVAECLSESRDGQTRLAQWAVAHRATVVMVTHECPRGATSQDNIRLAVTRLKWK